MDFAKAKLLLDTIEAAGRHGPQYQKLAIAADMELKKMIGAEFPSVARSPNVVTPAGGPANSLVQQPDGSLEQVRSAPSPGLERQGAYDPSAGSLIDESIERR